MAVVASNLYCSRADVTAELPVSGIASPGISASVSAATDEFESDGHALETDMPIRVRAEDASDAVLPSPLDEETTYYAIRVNNAVFKLSATQGGSAITIAEDADVVVTKEPRFDETIEFYSRWVDDLIPAEAVPLEEPIDPLVRGVVARLAAKRLMNANGQDSAIVTAEEVAAKAIIERHGAGIPIRGATTTGSTNKAIKAPASSGDPRGWGCGGV